MCWCQEQHFCSILTWTFLWNPIPETDKSIVIAEIGCRKKILSERIPLNGQWNNRTSLTKSNDRAIPNNRSVPGKPLKRKLPGTDEEEKHEKNKRYEGHRPERKLNMKWQDGWPWLQFNLEENSITCSICMDYYLVAKISQIIANKKG
jgi:hypothetical protein